MFFYIYSNILWAWSLVLFLLSIALIVAYFTNKDLKKKIDSVPLNIYYMLIWAISGWSIAWALVYEYYFELPVCHFCWLGRIFIFPVFFVTLISIWRNIKDNTYLILTLLSIALIIATYHSWIQFYGLHINPSFETTCSIDGPSCVSNDGVESFGFMTIPFMEMMVVISMMILAFLGIKSSNTNVKK